MPASSRRKGITGEREVARIWQAAGFEVRGLEGEGDHVVMLGNGIVVHSEVKNHAARLRMAEWLEQAKREAMRGTVPVLSFTYGGTWYSVLPLSDLATLAQSGNGSCPTCGEWAGRGKGCEWCAEFAQESGWNTDRGDNEPPKR